MSAPRGRGGRGRGGRGANSGVRGQNFIFNHQDPAIRQMITALQLAEDSGAGSDVVTAIKTALDLVKQREQFCNSMTTAESEACRHVDETTRSTDWRALKEEGKTEWALIPKMMSGNLEGQFLKCLISMQKAKRILEIGMFTGYGALAMAEALPADGQVVTVEKEEYLESYVKSLFQKSPHGSKITIHIGSAMDYMKKAAENKEKFDIIFLDADKSEYLDYLKIAMTGGLLSAGGTLLVDNAFKRGDAYTEESGDNPTKTFHAAVKADNSLHCVMLPMEDGLGLLRRRTDVEGDTPM